MMANSCVGSRWMFIAQSVIGNFSKSIENFYKFMLVHIFLIIEAIWKILLKHMQVMSYFEGPSERNIIVYFCYSSYLKHSTWDHMSTRQENVCSLIVNTTGNNVFAVCLKVYRGQLLEHTANNYFSMCHSKNARLRLGTPCVFLAHDKVLNFLCAFFHMAK